MYQQIPYDASELTAADVYMVTDSDRAQQRGRWHYHPAYVAAIEIDRGDIPWYETSLPVIEAAVARVKAAAEVWTNRGMEHRSCFIEDGKLDRETRLYFKGDLSARAHAAL